MTWTNTKILKLDCTWWSLSMFQTGLPWSCAIFDQQTLIT